jgi:hypothetical protein
MPFTIRPHRRVPVCCPVICQTGLFEGHGTVWNLSLTGWRFSGDLPLRLGEVCSLTVNLPTQQRIYVGPLALFDGYVARSMASKRWWWTTSRGRQKLPRSYVDTVWS